MNIEETRNESSSSTNEKTSVKDVITEYLKVSGWLPGVSVV